MAYLGSFESKGAKRKREGKESRSESAKKNIEARKKRGGREPTERELQVIREGESSEKSTSSSSVLMSTPASRREAMFQEREALKEELRDPGIVSQQQRYLEEINRRYRAGESVQGAKETIYEDYPELKDKTSKNKKEELKSTETGQINELGAGTQEVYTPPASLGLMQSQAPPGAVRTDYSYLTFDYNKQNQISQGYSYMDSELTKTQEFELELEEKKAKAKMLLEGDTSTGGKFSGFGAGGIYVAGSVFLGVKDVGKGLFELLKDPTVVLDFGKDIISQPGKVVGDFVEGFVTNPTRAITREVGYLYGVPKVVVAGGKVVARVGETVATVRGNYLFRVKGEAPYVPELEGVGQRTLSGGTADTSKILKDSPLGLPDEAYRNVLDPFAEKYSKLERPSYVDRPVDNSLLRQRSDYIEIFDKETGARLNIPREEFPTNQRFDRYVIGEDNINSFVQGQKILLDNPTKTGAPYSDKAIISATSKNFIIEETVPGQRTLGGDLADPSKVLKKPKTVEDSPLGLSDEAYRKLNPFDIEGYKKGDISRPRPQDPTFSGQNIRETQFVLEGGDTIKNFEITGARTKQTSLGQEDYLRVVNKKTGAEFDISKKSFAEGLKKGDIDPSHYSITGEYKPNPSTQYLRSELVPGSTMFAEGVGNVFLKYTPENRVLRGVDRAPSKYGITDPALAPSTKYYFESQAPSGSVMSPLGKLNLESSSAVARFQVPVEKQTPGIIDKSIIKNKIEEEQVSEIVSSQVIDQAPGVKIDVAEEQQSRQRTGGRTSQRTTAIQITTPIQETVQEPRLETPKEVPVFIPRVDTPRPRAFLEVPPAPPRELLVPTHLPQPKKEQEQESFFGVEVRRKGVFQQEAVTKGKEEAFYRGRDIVDSFSPASFRVIDLETGASVQSGLGFGRGKFTTSKKDSNVYVEKNKFRINTPGEKTEITYKGIFASRGTKKKGLNRKEFNLWRL